MKKLFTPAILASFILILVIFGYFSFHAPLMADNFVFSHDIQPGFASFYAGKEVKAAPLSFSSAFRQASEMYMSWCGRFTGNLAVYLSFMLPPVIGHILSTIGFGMYVLLLQIGVFGREWLEKLTPGWILGLAALVWLSVPSFGQAFLWLSVGGQIALLAQLLMLLPYRIALSPSENHAHAGCASWAAGGLFFLAGMFTSSLDYPGSATLPPTALATVIWIYFSRPKGQRQIPWILLLGGLGLLLGAILTLQAPGNVQRLLLTNDSSVIRWLALSWPEKIVYWLVRLPLLPKLFPVPFLILAWGLYALWKEKGKNFYKYIPVSSVFFFLPFCCATGAFLFSSWPPPRAFAGCSIELLLCALIIALRARGHASHALLNIWKRAWYILILWCAVSIVHEAYIFHKLKQAIEIRENIIAHSTSGDVVLPPLNVASSSYQALGGELQDISQDPAFWVNRAMALHYGLRSVRKDPGWTAHSAYFSDSWQAGEALELWLDKDRFYIKAENDAATALLENGAYIYYYGKPALLSKLPPFLADSIYSWLASNKIGHNFQWLVPILLARTDLDAISSASNKYFGRSPLIQLIKPNVIWLVQPGEGYSSFNLIPFHRKQMSQ